MVNSGIEVKQTGRIMKFMCAIPPSQIPIFILYTVKITDRTNVPAWYGIVLTFGEFFGASLGPSFYT